ncbi:MAG TPA: matrixin family metalloprotease [Burkholderiales bacterium]|nr:matrixin family metalloprotease [Burkholderiales bacterium]
MPDIDGSAPAAAQQAPPGAVAVPRIRPATQRVEATPSTVEEAMAQMQRKAREECRQWADKAFAEFERSTYKEPFEGGKYIVSGDIAIPGREQLREFFETGIKQEAAEPAPGALIVHRVGGRDAIWDSAHRNRLTYCVSSEFGNRQPQVVADMEAASGAWEAATDVDFVHVVTEDDDCTAANANVVFDVRPVNVNGQYLARAFFPNEQRADRNVLIDESAFQLDPKGALQLVGILRHELGHALGWRHEHTRPEAGTCFEDNDWRPLTDYDRFSVMHYPQCNGGGDWSLKLTDMDRNGAACVYGAAPGFEVDPKICPNPPERSAG